jgi:hypothetical protein
MSSSSSSITGDEIRLINIYKEIYTMNNEQITSLNTMQANILQKINSIILRSHQRGTNFYIYNSSEATPAAAATEEITQTQFRNIENPGNLECPVTYERFSEDSNVSKINLCGHIFMSSALNQWLETRNSCPVCRQVVRTRTSRSRSLASSLTNLTETLITRFLSADGSSNITDISAVVLDGISFL